MVRGHADSLSVRSPAHGWRGRALNRRGGAPAAERRLAARLAFGALVASALAALLGAGLALRLLADRRA